MSFGGSFGGRSRKPEQYFVLPKNRQRKPMADSGGWKLAKGTDDRSANTVKTFDMKMDAQRRRKELARKNDTILTVFDAAKKSSRQFSYR